MQRLQGSTLLSSFIKDKFLFEGSQDECYKNPFINNSMLGNRNQEFQQNSNQHQSGQFTNSEQIKELNGKSQRVTNDTLKQYVQRKIRQELSFILSQDAQAPNSNINTTAPKKKDHQLDQEDKVSLLQICESKSYNEGTRVKSISDITSQNINIENQLQNNKICLTEVNLSSQAYKKYQKKKQKYFQPHKSYQSPLLVPPQNPQNEERKFILKNETKQPNMRYEDLNRSQLNSQQVKQRNRLNSFGSEYSKIQPQYTELKEKPYKIDSRLRQSTQISPNLQSQSSNQNQFGLINSFGEGSFDLERSILQSRVSPKRFKFVKKQNSFSLNDGNNDQFQQQNLNDIQEESNNSESPKVKLRGLSVDQTNYKSIDKVPPSYILSCKSNLISQSTELPSDNYDNNSSPENQNNLKICKDNQIPSHTKSTKQHSNIDFPQINKGSSPNNQYQQKTRSPKFIRQGSQLSSQQIFSENSLILDKLPRQERKKLQHQQSYIDPSLPQIDNRQIIPASKFEILTGFNRNIKLEDQEISDNNHSQQNRQSQQINRIRSHSLMDFEDDASYIKRKKKPFKKLCSQDNVGVYSNEQEIKKSGMKQDINNYYSSYGDIIIENKYIPKKVNNIQYNNIKTIDEEDTLINSLDKSGCQFYKLKKYYYKKYAVNHY